MSNWQRFLKAPQTLWFRRALFQLHLWVGIGFGLYVFLISLSGSALLLRYPIIGMFEPSKIAPNQSQPLTGQALTDKVAQVYAGYEVTYMFESYSAERATFVMLKRGDEVAQHYFNQFTGEDMGNAEPWPILAASYLADLHDDLLMGPTGRKLNALGALVFVGMSLSGLFIWWQGKRRWYQGLIMWPGYDRGLVWQLHSFIGFWTLLLMFAWGVSGFQLGYPQQARALFSWLDLGGGESPPSEHVLRFFRRLHFARIGEGSWSRRVWIALSFLPGLLVISGTILWWRRVILGKLRSAKS